MADHVTQAKDLMVQAQKKLTSFSFFGSKTAKFEDAGELYKKAANLFKVGKQGNEAAQAYMEAAQCFLQSNNSQHEAATCYIKASGCFKKESHKEAADALLKAIALYTADGRFSMAAKYEKDLAELFEANNDIANAMGHYETAAEYFAGENSPSSANGCLLKVAHFAATAEDYKKAIQLFEEISQTSLANKLLQWSVKEYLLKAGLCNLCAGDVVEAKKALTRYMAMDPNFPSSRECKFLSAITDAYENRDEEAFTNSLTDYDTITPVDAWKTTLLNVIQDKIKKDDEDSDGVL